MFDRLFNKLKNTFSASNPTSEPVSHPTETEPNPATLNPIATDTHTENGSDCDCDCGCTATITETGEMDFCGLVLEKNINEHREYKDAIRQAFGKPASELYSTEVVISETSCELGKWLFNEARCLDKYSEYAVLVDVHRQFHECVAEAVLLHRKGDIIGAIKLFRDEVENLSGELESALVRLFHQVQAEQNCD